MKMHLFAPSFGALFCAVGIAGCFVAPALADPPQITVVSKNTAPVLDGVINAAEYGPGQFVSFAGDANPGRFAVRSNKTSASASDLSFTMYTAHTADTVFLGFDVKDQFIDDRFGAPFQNDALELFFDADHAANDFVPYRGIYNYSREGFQLVSDVNATKFTAANGYFGNGDWHSAVTRTADGYMMEFAIPLGLMDKVDGPGYAAVTTGDHVNFNVAIDDNDRYTGGQDAQGGLYILDPNKYQCYTIGEDGWVADMYLAPAAVPEPGPIAFGLISGAGLLGLVARKRRQA